ncbi:MTOR-associated protein MEAK7 [Capsicum galapagoense]
MGNSQSNSTNPRFTLAKRAFTEKKLQDLKSLFDSLAAQSQSSGQYVSPSVFKAYIGVEGPLGDRMFDLVTQKRKDQKLTYEDLVIAKGTYEKGTNDDIEEFIYQLLDVFGDGTVGRSDLEAVLTAVLRNISSHESHQPEPSSDREVLDSFLNAANLTTDDKNSAENCLSFEEFRRWCAHLPSVRKFLGSLLSPRGSGTEVPMLIHPKNIDPAVILLSKEYAWHIGGALPKDELHEWRLLYHSTVHGLSFNTFLGNISNDKGPTLLIIKDREGYIYGGYASQPWERHADFYGDMKSFLFQLYPIASVFRPTGANSNIQWCAINFSSESIPNGIGFGGRVNHFGSFISANFDQGHTFTCTTFGSPSLSKTQKIFPEVIECWGVQIKRAQEDTQDRLKGTVLDRFKEDRHMLNMVGLANSSE